MPITPLEFSNAFTGKDFEGNRAFAWRQCSESSIGTAQGMGGIGARPGTVFLFHAYGASLDFDKRWEANYVQIVWISQSKFVG